MLKPLLPFGSEDFSFRLLSSSLKYTELYSSMLLYTDVKLGLSHYGSKHRLRVFKYRVRRQKGYFDIRGKKDGLETIT
jgi:hypothetical protein